MKKVGGGGECEDLGPFESMVGGGTHEIADGAYTLQDRNEGRKMLQPITILKFNHLWGVNGKRPTKGRQQFGGGDYNVTEEGKMARRNIFTITRGSIDQNGGTCRGGRLFNLRGTSGRKW